MGILDGDGEYVPGHRPIDDTDLEISYNMSGTDLILRVNKGGVLVFRVLLENAAADLRSDQLISFSPVAPDFLFKIGDTAEGIRRLARSIGLPTADALALNLSEHVCESDNQRCDSAASETTSRTRSWTVTLGQVLGRKK